MFYTDRKFLRILNALRNSKKSVNKKLFFTFYQNGKQRKRMTLHYLSFYFYFKRFQGFPPFKCSVNIWKNVNFCFALLAYYALSQFAFCWKKLDSHSPFFFNLISFHFNANVNAEYGEMNNNNNNTKRYISHLAFDGHKSEIHLHHSSRK